MWALWAGGGAVAGAVLRHLWRRRPIRVDVTVSRKDTDYDPDR